MKFIKFFTVFISAFAIVFSLTNSFSAAESAEKVVIAELPEKYLDEQEKELYRRVLKNVVAISEGRQTAETFYIEMPTPFPSKKKYEEAVEKVMFFILQYTPEYSFWTDSSGYLVYSTTRCGIIYGISPAYQTNGDENRIDPSRLNDVKSALANAQTIADKYEKKSAYEKIIGYAEEICRLNEYNHAAADDKENYSQQNRDPWELVYVFDNDPSTNVVCSGYAHAFQYLCGLGGIVCHYVSGPFNGEDHAWNIVELDGKSYFADVTACDGFPEADIKKYHPYILDNVAANAADGFSTFFQNINYLPSGINTYKYGDEEMKYLPAELRTLSTEPFHKRGYQFELWHLALILLVGLTIFRFVRRILMNRNSDDY